MLDIAEEKPKQRRVKRGQRRQIIIEQATQIFSDSGFSASTRDIAKAMNVTQALLYKYFPSKDKLVEEVFKEEYANENKAPDPSILKSDRPLEDRLQEFYEGFYSRRTGRTGKLFMRAALNSLPVRDTYLELLHSSFIMPVANALRAHAGLENLEARPLSKKEFELVMILHGGVSFLAIRHHIYGATPVIEYQESIRQIIKVWLTGATPEMKAIHDNWNKQETYKKQ